ncbi:ANK_REP_REGION domain-containing protein [Caenorhabditis elegans]|uniref:ANK_REP_REGION domain-containing protein n=1 Tax=Caenorhabditis elegans TaxID=6239 RepID=Q93567_CAEEL|nr:ANK_REP_REGION domain-containing protein [Caenorhabditis elegans]CAB02092.3 ANK_REP_REGION domain-containing protein [Caenorhabditis elegans]|eukprot:NP_492759.3 Uncharacterized protein CELE_F25H2.3 [Caenorhabditis elegans]
MRACKVDNPFEIIKLLNEGANPNATDHAKNTCSSTAVLNMQPENVRILLEVGANPEAICLSNGNRLIHDILIMMIGKDNKIIDFQSDRETILKMFRLAMDIGVRMDLINKKVKTGCDLLNILLRNDMKYRRDEIYYQKSQEEIKIETGQLNTIGSDKPSIHLAEEVEEMQMLEVTESDSWKTQENPIINRSSNEDQHGKEKEQNHLICEQETNIYEETSKANILNLEMKRTRFEDIYRELETRNEVCRMRENFGRHDGPGLIIPCDTSYNFPYSLIGMLYLPVSTPHSASDRERKRKWFWRGSAFAADVARIGINV